MAATGVQCTTLAQQWTARKVVLIIAAIEVGFLGERTVKPFEQKIRTPLPAHLREDWLGVYRMLFPVRGESRTSARRGMERKAGHPCNGPHQYEKDPSPSWQSLLLTCAGATLGWEGLKFQNFEAIKRSSTCFLDSRRRVVCVRQ